MYIITHWLARNLESKSPEIIAQLKKQDIPPS